MGSARDRICYFLWAPECGPDSFSGRLRRIRTDTAGLRSDYDFALSWEGDDMYSGVPDAMDKFGLKLEMKKRGAAFG
jgi:hypothetical protein